MVDADPMSEKQQGFIHNLIITGQLTRLIIYICTGVAVGVFLLFAFLRSLGIFGLFYFTAVDFFVFAILSGCGIFGFYQYFHMRRIHKIDSIFPDFVRDIAESRRAGMTFTKAVMFAAKGNYGVLTPEIAKIAQQVSWGSSIDEALTSFSKRVNTKTIKRTVSLIVEASRSGGNVADVLDVASRDAREIKILDAERRANMSSYVVVIYVGNIVFFVILVILCKQFLPAITSSGTSAVGPAVSGLGGLIKQSDVVPIFYYACLAQSIGSGLVAGAFEEGNMIGGVKHMFILVVITWVVFKFLVGV